MINPVVLLLIQIITQCVLLCDYYRLRYGVRYVRKTKFARVTEDSIFISHILVLLLWSIQKDHSGS